MIAHDSARVLEACLDSIRGVFAETIIVDNASRDDSPMTARRHCMTEDGQVIAKNEQGDVLFTSQKSTEGGVTVFDQKAQLAKNYSSEDVQSAKKEYLSN